MTIVEFFDRSPIENVLSLLAFSPARIIFVGDKDTMRRQKPRYDRFFKTLRTKPPIEFRVIDKTDLQSIVDVLAQIAECEDICSFDLTGGDDLTLTATGMVFERYCDKGTLRMHRFDLASGKAYDAVSNTPLKTIIPSLTIEQLVLLYGGAIGGSTDGDAPTTWNFSKNFCDAINCLWEINSADPSHFNKQISRLCAFEKYKRPLSQPLRVCIDGSVLKDRIDRYTEKQESVSQLLTQLARNGLITLHTCDGDIDFTYACAQIKRCLSKAGNLLELKTLLTARRLQDNGKPLITDSLCGVYIDWDGRFIDSDSDTLNEIDVMLMHGVTPIFISCKNGTVDDAELYKLSVVADRFGGVQAKKVLIATYVERNPMVREHLLQRAADMGIALIDYVHRLSDKDFESALKAACVKEEHV